MSTIGMHPRTSNDDPFARLVRIPSSPYYLYPVPKSSQAPKAFPQNNDPKLILLCTWTDASPKHIIKYIEAYREIFTTSPILLVRTFSSDFFSVSEKALQRKLEPAIKIIRSYLDDESDEQSNQGFLAHALSNGGSGHLTYLARQYFADTSGALPVNAVILDSTPTRAGFQSLLDGLSTALPSPFWIHLPLKALLVVLIFAAYVVPRWVGMKNMADRVYDDLISVETIDESGCKTHELLRKEAARCYIYSEADKLCPAKDIELNAREALRLGIPTRSEVWVGSGHVAHMKLDGERYWRVVRETWERRG